MMILFIFILFFFETVIRISVCYLRSIRTCSLHLFDFVCMLFLYVSVIFGTDDIVPWQLKFSTRSKLHPPNLSSPLVLMVVLKCLHFVLLLLIPSLTLAASLINIDVIVCSGVLSAASRTRSQPKARTDLHFLIFWHCSVLFIAFKVFFLMQC